MQYPEPFLSCITAILNARNFIVVQTYIMKFAQPIKCSTSNESNSVVSQVQTIKLDQFSESSHLNLINIVVVQ